MKITVFWEEGFPSTDAPGTSRAALEQALTGHAAQFAGLDRLADALKDCELLVMPYGSAFPKDAWLAICDYLRGGGNWLNLGGAPFTRPVRSTGGRWEMEIPQTAYSKELLINHAFPTDIAAGVSLECASEELDLKDLCDGLEIDRAWALQFRFSDTGQKDFPREMGTSGRRDAVLKPLLRAVEGDRVLAVPIVAIDRIAGPCRGGRWVLLNAHSETPFSSELVGRLAAYAIALQVQLEAVPSFACYYDGEQARIDLRAIAPNPIDLRLTVEVLRGDRVLYKGEHETRVGAGPAIVSTPTIALQGPGLYKVRARAFLKGTGDSRPLATAENGFWVYDENILTTAGRLGVNRDYFVGDGRVVPITGATYMSGDKHRKFLFEPNPAVWDADFAAMQRAGVNMVRTGFWTGWKKIMCDRGAVDEGALRAFAAFLLSAGQHGITVILNLFAFMPEEWGGENPYIDPDSIAAQQAFIVAFASRFASANNLMYDFINEPSFCSPDRQWSVTPNYDRHEHAAWGEWIRGRFEVETEWATRWRRTPRNAAALPRLVDFHDADIFQGAQPIGTLDYKLFSQEMFARWCRQLGSVIRECGNPYQLLTVGQDEGGTADRSNPWFYGPSVDFTCNHPWWMNDDTLFNSVITKTPSCPNLMQELGIMFLENVDGSARRSLDDCAALLERKMVLSFAAGCGGFIQWLWNTNVYMDSDNEVGIGFLHADGSEKPELNTFRGVAAFFRKAAPTMVDRRAEDVCVVIPHSLMFSVRKQAPEAVKRAVRTLEYRTGLACRGIGEYRIEEIGQPRLIVLPSPRVLTDECWTGLLQRVEQGCTLLATGYLEADPWWRPVDRLGQFGLKTSPGLLGHEERAEMQDGPPLEFTYSGDTRHKGDKAVLADGGGDIGLRTWIHGRGEIIYCPLPAELAQSEQQTEALYRFAAGRAGLPVDLENQPGILIRRVEFAEATLHLMVNESGSLQRAVLASDGRKHEFEVAAGRSAMALVERSSGKILALYPES